MDMNSQMIAHMLYAALLLAFLAPGIWARTRGKRLPYAMIWLAALVALAWGYELFSPYFDQDRGIEQPTQWHQGETPGPAGPAHERGI